MLDFDIALIGKRGGNLCGADRFSIQACSKCQGHYLYNEEVGDVYFDADNLDKRYFKIDGLSLPPCRYCGQLHWQFAPVAPDQLCAQAGPWGWALKRRVYVFS